MIKSMDVSSGFEQSKLFIRFYLLILTVQLKCKKYQTSLQI